MGLVGTKKEIMLIDRLARFLSYSFLNVFNIISFVCSYHSVSVKELQGR